jgi:hypothetical protein
LHTVARHLTALCHRYTDTIESAITNDYLWSHVAAPVDVGNIEIIGISALAAVHFRGAEIIEAVIGEGVRSDDLSLIPVRIGGEIAQQARRSRKA